MKRGTEQTEVGGPMLEIRKKNAGIRIGILNERQYYEKASKFDIPCSVFVIRFSFLTLIEAPDDLCSVKAYAACTAFLSFFRPNHCQDLMMKKTMMPRISLCQPG